MSPTRFRFGHRGRYLGDAECTRRRTIAAGYGIRFVQEREPWRGGGWCSYFEAPVRGHDEDVALTHAVAAEIDR